MCVIVLAIGIGATTAAFAVPFDVLLTALADRGANRIVFVHDEFPSPQLGHAFVSVPDYAAAPLKGQALVFHLALKTYNL